MEPMPPRRKWLYIGWTLTYLLCLIYVVASYLFPDVTGHIIRCPLHEFTGLRCPSCGLTRAAMELLHGNFAAACRHNILIIPVVLLTVAFPIVLVSDLCFGTRLLSFHFSRRSKYGEREKICTPAE